MEIFLGDGVLVIVGTFIMFSLLACSQWKWIFPENFHPPIYGAMSSFYQAVVVLG